MKTVNIHEAKTQLSRLIAEATSGEEIIIAKSGKPLVRLVPLRDDGLPRTPGRDRGVFAVPADFDAPLPDDILGEFES